jgi:hypothetical protein
MSMERSMLRAGFRSTKVGTLVLSLLLATTGVAQAAKINYAFDFRELKSPSEASKRYRCPKMVGAMTDMSQMFAFYKPSKTASVIDKAKMTAYIKKMKLAVEAKQGLSTLVTEALTQPTHRTAARLCILKQVRVWALRNALLGNLEDNDLLGHRQAVLEMIWTSIAFANAYAIATQIAPSAPEYDRAIRQWFTLINQQIIAEFTPKPRLPKDAWLDIHANHRYWAAAAVASLSSHTGNRGEFDWAMDILMTAVDEADPDGGLKHELARGGRSLHYETFALDALSILTAFADANKVQFGQKRENKLGMVAKFAADAYQNPKPLEVLTGSVQERNGAMLKWTHILTGHFAATNPKLAAQLGKLSDEMQIPADQSCADVCVAFYDAERR